MVNSDKIIFEGIFNDHYGQLYVHALGLVKDEEDAKDITHDVFCYFWENLERYDLKTNILPLLYKMVHNRCIDFIRHINAEKNYISSHFEGMGENSNEDEYDYADYQERMQRVANEIDKLPPQTRRAFVEAVLHEKSYKEVAEFLHIQPSTVKTLISRAYKTLRQNIQFLLFFLYPF
jgi:RNA polymerase sigma-70 factor (ECF subfamily)